METKIISTVKTQCKGKTDSGQCKEEVTYKRDPIPGVVLQKMPEEIDVYLTCPIGHTCKYRVTKTGLN